MLLSLDGVLGFRAGPDASVGPVPNSAQVSVVTTSPTDSTATSALVSLAPSAAPAGVAVATAGDVQIHIVARPALLLVDQDGNTLSSLDGPPFSEATPGDAELTLPNDSALAEQAKELTPEGLAALPMVSWSPDAKFHGALDATRGWISFAVPVGPTTNTLRMAVHPEHVEGDGDLPMARVDQMYLIQADGTVIASLTGVATVTTSSQQSLTITLQSAPAGSFLVVRLVNPMSQSANSTAFGSNATNGAGSAASAADSTAIGALTPSPNATTSDFMVDVQRDDSVPQSPVTSTDYTPWIATLDSQALSSNSAGNVHPGAILTGPSLSMVSYEPSYTRNTKSSSSGGSQVSIEASDPDSESTAISLGPLVSRGAAPIGPALATSTDDPAPSIDREAQIDGDAALSRLDGDEVERLSRLSRDARGVDSSELEGADENASPVTILKGLGGLPLLVGSLNDDHGAHRAEELVATLREPADQAIPPTPSNDLDHESGRAGVARAGIATRAAGIIVALGLASGPLYPDLIALAKRRLSRRRPGSAKSTRRRFSWPSL